MILILGSTLSLFMIIVDLVPGPHRESTGLGERLDDYLTLRILYSIRGVRLTHPDIVLVLIDESTGSKIGEKPNTSDWNRSIHAKVIERIKLAGGRLIFYDVFFKAKGKKDANYADAILAKAIKNSGNVILVSSVLTDNSPLFSKSQPPANILTRSALGVRPLPIPEMPLVNHIWTRYPDRSGIETAPLALFQQLMPSVNTLETVPVFMKLNYYGPSRTFKHIPFENIALETEAGHGFDVENKVVFVGFANQIPGNSQDSHHTHFRHDDGLNLSGVEIAATGLSNLLDDSYLKYTPLNWRMVIFVSGAVVFSMLIAMLGSFGIFINLVLLSGYSFIAFVIFDKHHMQLPLAVPLIGYASGVIVALNWVRRDTQRSRKRLAAVLNRYLPSRVSRKIDSEGLKALSTREITAICLSTDVENYVTLSEHISPTVLAELNSRYFDLIIRIVSSSGGDVVDTTGDSLLSIWPVDSESEKKLLASRACQSVLSIRDELERFALEHPDTPYRTRFGITLGTVAIGDIGGSGKYSFRAVGDAINRASRLQSLNKNLGSQILVERPVVELLDSHIVSTFRGEFEVKGRKSRLFVYEIKHPAS